MRSTTPLHTEIIYAVHCVLWAGSVLLFLFVTLPMLKFAFLGLTGGLLDAGRDLNTTTGSIFLAFGVLLLLVHAGMALASFALLRARGRREKKGYCPVCQYDLKAAWERGCPECGWNRPAGEGAAAPDSLTSPASAADDVTG